jgi:hypothetical protein
MDNKAALIRPRPGRQTRWASEAPKKRTFCLVGQSPTDTGKCPRCSAHFQSFVAEPIEPLRISEGIADFQGRG